MTKDEGGFVYPMPVTPRGMTLRQHYAGMAMQGLLACPDLDWSSARIAKAAYVNADEMIAEGRKEGE